MLHTSHRTSTILQTMIEEHTKDTITLEDLANGLADRSFGIGILIFALPNAIPLGIPGISSVCAVPIILFSLQMALGRHHLWLPRRLANIQFSMKTLSFAITKTLPWLRKLEAIIHPRALSFANGWAERLTGLMIAILAAVIFLPIPFGNFLPAICMCLLAMGLLEDDGYLVIGAFIASVATLVGMSYAIIAIFMQLMAWIF